MVVQCRIAGWRRAVSRVELLVMVLVLLAMVAIVLPQLQRSTRPHGLRDATQLRDIHQSLLVAARDLDGALPQPAFLHEARIVNSRIVRAGQDKPEAVSLNTTANLYSYMIAGNYFTANVCISPLENNPRVKVMRHYNYDAFNPQAGVWWDAQFRGDLDVESHASYAHLLLYGRRVNLLWRDLPNSSSSPVLSNRGPLNGIGDPKSYTCDKRGRWRGRLIFGDGHVEILNDPGAIGRYGPHLTGGRSDNIFAVDDGMDGADVILTFTLAIDPEKGPTIQHD